ncbi:MAG: hypothetical protein M1383_02495 [Patescibacteria group bacterium]|nr:hypothetical protein [Patescibacteria group bacterium]
MIHFNEEEIKVNVSEVAEGVQVNGSLKITVCSKPTVHHPFYYMECVDTQGRHFAGLRPQNDPIAILRRCRSSDSVEVLAREQSA